MAKTLLFEQIEKRVTGAAYNSLNKRRVLTENQQIDHQIEQNQLAQNQRVQQQQQQQQPPQTPVMQNDQLIQIQQNTIAALQSQLVQSQQLIQQLVQNQMIQNQTQAMQTPAAQQLQNCQQQVNDMLDQTQCELNQSQENTLELVNKTIQKIKQELSQNQTVQTQLAQSQQTQGQVVKKISETQQLIQNTLDDEDEIEELTVQQIAQLKNGYQKLQQLKKQIAKQEICVSEAEAEFKQQKQELNKIFVTQDDGCQDICPECGAVLQSAEDLEQAVQDVIDNDETLTVVQQTKLLKCQKQLTQIIQQLQADIVKQDTSDTADVIDTADVVKTLNVIKQNIQKI